jgi:hypothetical protein
MFSTLSLLLFLLSQTWWHDNLKSTFHPHNVAPSVTLTLKLPCYLFTNIESFSKEPCVHSTEDVVALLLAMPAKWFSPCSLLATVAWLALYLLELFLWVTS